MSFLLLVLAIDFNSSASVVRTALDNSPTLTRLQAEAAAARERIETAGQLPNPMVMGGVREKMAMVGASQTVVRPSKRTSQRKAAELEARAAGLMVDAARLEIERDVRMQWWEIAAIDAQLANAREVREMIDAIVAAARVRYEVGTAEQSDVIRAQLETSNLDHEILRLRGARRAAVARLLPLLALPPDTAVPPLTLPENTEDLALDAPVSPPADHPAIAALEAEAEAQDEEIRLARLERKPDVDVEAQYGFRRSEREISLIARIELPIDEKIDPRVREMIALRDAAKTRIEELKRSLTRELAAAVAVHAEVTEQLRLHQEVLVPQARLAFDSALAAYQTGRAPFDAILTTETDYLRLQLQYFDLLARHAQAVVTYEAIR